MHGRLTRIKGTPEGLEESVRTFEKDVAAPARGEPGFRGLALMGNRKTGDAITIAYWEDLAAMEASAERMKQLRAALTAGSGGKGAGAARSAHATVLPSKERLFANPTRPAAWSGSTASSPLSP